MRAFVGDTVLTSPVWNWGEYSIPTVQAAIAGEWETHSYWEGLNEDVVALAEYSAKAPQDVRDLVEAAKQAIIENDQIFCGPIRDQAGNEVVASGKCLSDEEKLGMQFFVEGVIGTIPSN
jgi:basic membrane protein A and related proteins